MCYILHNLTHAHTDTRAQRPCSINLTQAFNTFRRLMAPHRKIEREYEFSCVFPSVTAVFASICLALAVRSSLARNAARPAAADSRAIDGPLALFAHARAVSSLALEALQNQRGTSPGSFCCQKQTRFNILHSDYNIILCTCS